MRLNKTQIKFLDEFAKGRWTFNDETGLVDIEGDFCCSREKIERNLYRGRRKALTDFKGVNFGVVTGNFYCSHNTIKSLRGAPRKVGGDFRCCYNRLTNLKGAPQEVSGSFYCYGNRLTSLVGAPKEVGGDFYCTGNKLTNLVGATQEVEGNFWCDNNKLTSLVGAPQKVGGSFFCNDNPLTSLVGAPQQINGYLSCKCTKLTSLEGAPMIVFYKTKSTFWKNPISEDTLELVWDTMRKNEIDYRTALISLKGEIPARDWKKMNNALEEEIWENSI